MNWIGDRRRSALIGLLAIALLLLTACDLFRPPLRAVIQASPASGETPLTVNFDGSSSSGDIASYGWDFGDPTSIENEAVGVTATHTYKRAGSYTAALTITDSRGNQTTNTVMIEAQATEAKVIIEDSTLEAGKTGSIKILVENVPGPGLTDFQVGQEGYLTFDPQVIRVEEISPLDGFTILAEEIDNAAGRVQLAAAVIQGDGLTQGEVVGLKVKAVGKAGDKSELVLTGVDVFRDKDGHGLSFDIIDGIIIIKP